MRGQARQSPVLVQRAVSEVWEGGAARPSFLLAERARSECARSMRAVKDSLKTPLRVKCGISEGPRLGKGASRRAGGGARSMRAVEDQSAPIPRGTKSKPRLTKSGALNSKGWMKQDRSLYFCLELLLQSRWTRRPSRVLMRDPMPTSSHLFRHLF